MKYYPEETSRQKLPILYCVIVTLSVAIFYFYKQHDQILHIELWYLFPVWVLISHPICAGAFVITSLSVKRAVHFLRNSFSVYGRYRSVVQLQVAFLTSLLEETVFRYFLLTFLADLLKSTGGAILLTSIAFAIFHYRRLGPFLPNFLMYIDMFIFSIVISSLNVGTASFYPAFIIHGMRNYILRTLTVSKNEGRWTKP